MALDGEGEYKAGEWCRFCKARFQCRTRAEEYLHLAQMEFSQPALLTDEEIAEVLSKADALKKWAEEIYTYAQNEAITNRKEWPGFKLVLGRSNRKYTDEEEVAEAAKTAGYTDIYRTSLISITEMEKLMGKKKFRAVMCTSRMGKSHWYQIQIKEKQFTFQPQKRILVRRINDYEYESKQYESYYFSESILSSRI